MKTRVFIDSELDEGGDEQDEDDDYSPQHDPDTTRRGSKSSARKSKSIGKITSDDSKLKLSKHLVMTFLNSLLAS